MTGTVAPQLPEYWLTLLRNCGSAAPEYPPSPRSGRAMVYENTEKVKRVVGEV